MLLTESYCGPERTHISLPGSYGTLGIGNQRHLRKVGLGIGVVETGVGIICVDMKEKTGWLYEAHLYKQTRNNHVE